MWIENFDRSSRLRMIHLLERIDRNAGFSTAFRSCNRFSVGANHRKPDKPDRSTKVGLLKRCIESSGHVFAGTKHEDAVLVQAACDLLADCEARGLIEVDQEVSTKDHVKSRKIRDALQDVKFAKFHHLSNSRRDQPLIAP